MNGFFRGLRAGSRPCEDCSFRSAALARDAGSVVSDELSVRPGTYREGCPRGTGERPAAKRGDKR